jgi:hypothetical protein
MGSIMQKNNFKNSNEALVGIVVTFLLIGLIVSVLSIIQTVYIPKWMEQTESEHMDEVADQFAQLKSAIDIQAVIGSSQFTHTSISTISTGITLGSRELPFFMSTRAYGSLNILPDTSYRVVIKDINNATKFDNSSATIQYSSSNAYFLDQSYIYEGGAVVLTQYQGKDQNIILTKPAFSVNRGLNNVTINFTIIKIFEVGGKGSIAGYGTYPIQTEYSSNESSIINNVFTLTIYTKYQNAWFAFIDDTLKNGNFEPTEYTIRRDNSSGTVIVTFTNSNSIPKVNINLKLIKIAAQIAPGWVENTKP